MDLGALDGRDADRGRDRGALADLDAPEQIVNLLVGHDAARTGACPAVTLGRGFRGRDHLDLGLVGSRCFCRGRLGAAGDERRDETESSDGTEEGFLHRAEVAFTSAAVHHREPDFLKSSAR
jgi:hypothetical protein